MNLRHEFYMTFIDSVWGNTDRYFFYKMANYKKWRKLNHDLVHMYCMGGEL